MDGRIEALTVLSVHDAVLFHVFTEDGREKLYTAKACIPADKVRWARLLFDFDPAPSWPEVKVKATQLFPELERLSRKSWDRARKEGWCSALFSPRGRPSGRPSKRSSKKRQIYRPKMA